ncbi:hypothetical protein T08_6906 [Trichinella sp. T8]|nr:hypothetical protein T08_6906 [Trichinella sp. T8]
MNGYQRLTDVQHSNEVNLPPSEPCILIRSQLVTVLNIWSKYVTHAADLNCCIPFPAPARHFLNNWSSRSPYMTNCGKIDQHMLLAAESILDREVKRMDELAEFQRHLNACWQIKIESLQMVYEKLRIVNQLKQVEEIELKGHGDAPGKQFLSVLFTFLTMADVSAS